MLILSIETSCDETSVAILEDEKVLSNITISQILEQKKFGGVLPGLAAKLHVKNIYSVLQQAFFQAQKLPQDIDYIAYTKEPGLVICLQIGKIVAETFALFLNKPIIACNHLAGHAYSSLINSKKKWKFPVLSLIVSGGHTQLYCLDNHCSFVLLGETLDDAVGECLDKSAIILGYDYPGGPIVERLAKTGKNIYSLPFPKNDSSCDFSFSGLKSEVNRLVKSGLINPPDLFCSLQTKIAEIITKKLRLAWEKKNYQTVAVGGGVIANSYLREKITSTVKAWNPEVEVFFPEKEYSTDNAAMIGILAYYQIINQNEQR